MKYKRRGRWEGYSGWLALGNGPTWQARIVQGYERGCGVRASVTSQAAPSYPLCPSPHQTDGKYLVWASLVYPTAAFLAKKVLA